MSGNQGCCCHANIQTSQLSKHWSFTTAKVSQTNESESFTKTYFISSYKSQGAMETPPTKENPLPDIRANIKPWYFVEAKQYNIEVAKTATTQHMNTDNNEFSFNFNKLFEMILQMNGMMEESQACGCQTSNPLHKSTSLSEFLNKDDKKQLEGLHQHAVKKGVEVRYVNYIATHYALEKMNAEKPEQSNPTLGKNYFNDVISGMSVWNKEDAGSHIFNQLSEYFT